MKLKTNEIPTTREGTKGQKEFTIKANPKAFDILSRGIYTDVPRAIIRELSTNAHDAQVEAGNADKPFDVQLPTTFKPEFKIRDYGTGMSPEVVEHVYTTYFESTRSDSNEFTGCLGLGSKTPLAYSDSFTVTSYHEGTKYVYTVTRDQGIPTIDLFGEFPTDEPNGMEITLKVKPEDHWDFKCAAEKVYQWFKVRPNVIGHSLAFDDSFDTAEFQGDDYRIFVDSGWRNRGITVIMSQIAYKVDHNDIRNPFDQNCTIVLTVDTGDVSIATSREELQYDKDTVAYINDRLEEIAKGIRDEIKSKVDSKTTAIDRIAAMVEYRNIIKFDMSQTRFKAKPDNDAYSMRFVHTDYTRMYIEDRTYIDAIGDIHPVFIECDVEEFRQGHRNSIRHWMSGQKNHHGHTLKRAWLVRINDRAEFVKLFGEPKIKLSDIPKPPRKQGVRATGDGNIYYKYCLSDNYDRGRKGQYYWSSQQKKDNVDANGEKACYVVRRGDNVEDARIDFNWRHGALMRLAQSLGYDRVYGIPPSMEKRFVKDCRVPHLMDGAKTKIENEIAGWTRFEIARLEEGPSSISYDFKQVAKGIDPAVDDLLAFSEARKPSHSIVSSANLLGIEIPSPGKDDDFFQKVVDKYPLLQYISLYNLNTTAAAEVVEYIKLKKQQS